MEAIILLTIFLIIFYFIGSKRNKNVLSYYLNKLDKNIKCKDKKFVNMGGGIGVYAEFYIGDNILDRIETSVILMPRESIWVIFSYFMFGGDRLRINFVFKNKFKSGYILVEKKKFYLKKIEEKIVEYEHKGKSWLLFCDDGLYNNNFILKCLEMFEDCIRKIEVKENYCEIELCLKKHLNLKRINELVDFFKNASVF